MNKITIMDENANTQPAVMQQVSGMGIEEAEDVSTDDLLYLIKQTNSANQDYLNESEQLRQKEFEEEKRLEAKEQEERIRRENEQRFMEEERLRLERIRQEEAETLKKQKKQEGIQQQDKEKAVKKEEKDRKRKKEKQENRSQRHENRPVFSKIKIALLLFLAYNVCSIGTALYLIMGGGR